MFSMFHGFITKTTLYLSEAYTGKGWPCTFLTLPTLPLKCSASVSVHQPILICNEWNSTSICSPLVSRSFFVSLFPVASLTSNFSQASATFSFIKDYSYSTKQTLMWQRPPPLPPSIWTREKLLSWLKRGTAGRTCVTRAFWPTMHSFSPSSFCLVVRHSCSVPATWVFSNKALFLWFRKQWGEMEPFGDRLEPKWSRDWPGRMGFTQVTVMQ